MEASPSNSPSLSPGWNALNGADFQALEKAAALFSDKNDKSFLEEILSCLRDTGDPIQALALLKAMAEQGFASREDPKRAMQRVGQWLEQRLLREPGVAVQRLQLEITWLKRLIVAQGAFSKPPEGAKYQQNAGGKSNPAGQGASGVGFGTTLEKLRSSRATALDSSSKKAVASTKTEVEEAKPTPATLTRKKGDGTLTAMLLGGKKAEVRKPKADALWNALPPEVKAKIDKGKAVPVQIRYSQVGNALQIESID